MAGKGLSGQLSMFDFWSNIDGSEEVQMVSLMPEETLPTQTAAVMHREILAGDGSVAAEISFLNYNRVYVKRRGMEGEYRQFDNAKDAVDFYIDEMWKLN